MTADEIHDELSTLRLSDQCKRVAALRFGQRLTYEKISEEVGICKTRVFQHLAIARKRYPVLENLLAPDGRLAKKNISAA